MKRYVRILSEFYQNDSGSSERRAAKWVLPAVVIIAVLAVGILAFLAGMRFAGSRDSSGGRMAAKSEEVKSEEIEAKGEDVEEVPAEAEETDENPAQTENVTAASETQETKTQEVDTAETHEDFTGENFYIAPAAGGYRCLDMSVSEGNEMLMLGVEPQGNEQFVFYLMRYTLPVENGQIAEGTFSVEPIFLRSMAHYTGDGIYEFDDGNSHTSEWKI